MSPYNLFAGTPANLMPAEDDGAVSLGTEFEVQTPCVATQIRWLRAISSGAGQRTGAIYRVSDRVLLTPIVQLALPDGGTWGATDIDPVELAPGVRYRVVVWHPAGRYVAEPAHFMGASRMNGPLLIPNSAGSTAQGSYDYGGSIAMPTQTYNGSAYFSDVTVVELPSGPKVPLKVRGTDGWQERMAAPRVFGADGEWAAVLPKYWDGSRWSDVPA